MMYMSNTFKYMNNPPKIRLKYYISLRMGGISWDLGSIYKHEIPYE
jgi:hypothetical protein